MRSIDYIAEIRIIQRERRGKMAKSKNKSRPAVQGTVFKCGIFTTLFLFLFSQLKSLNKSMRLNKKTAQRFIMGLTGIKYSLMARNSHYVTYAL
jgi:hypothetical protein